MTFVDLQLIINGGSNYRDVEFGVLNVNGSGMTPYIQSYDNTDKSSYTLFSLNPKGGGVTIGSATTVNNALLYVNGNIVLAGSVSSNNGSDRRLKNLTGEAKDCLATLLSLGDVYKFRYNDLAVEGKDWLDSDTLHTGLIYQNAMKANIPGFTGVDDKGYGWVNYLSPDYQATLLGGLMEVSGDTDTLKEECKRLKEELKAIKDVMVTLAPDLTINLINNRN